MVQVTHEYPSEVATARQQAMQQWKLSQDMKTEFLKKLHKVSLSLVPRPSPLHCGNVTAQVLG